MLALLANEDRYGFDLVRTLGSIDGMVTGKGMPGSVGAGGCDSPRPPDK